MAENETLNASGSLRWRRVCEAFRRGDDDETVVNRIRENLYRFVRKSLTHLNNCEVGLAQLLDAATGTKGDLRALLRKCKPNEFARIIAENAEAGLTRPELMLRVMENVWKRLADDFSIKAVDPSSFWTDLDEFHTHLESVRRSIQRDLENIANRLGTDPDWKPRASRRRRAEPTGATLFDDLTSAGVNTAPVDPATQRTNAILGMSLLGGGLQA